MARINIENEFWTDPRKDKLARLLGSELLAIGVVCKLWRSAQVFWSNGKKGIPLDVFYCFEFAKEVLESGFAKIRVDDNDVYVCGYAEHYEWLISCKTNGRLGGVASGVTRKINNLTEAKRSERNHPNPNPNPNQNKIHTRASHGCEVLIEIWNKNRGSLAKVLGTNSSRLPRMKKAWAENCDAEYWNKLVARLAASPFCTGSGPRGWRADFDYLLRPGVHQQIFEGKYDTPESVEQKNPILIKMMEEENAKLRRSESGGLAADKRTGAGGDV